MNAMTAAIILAAGQSKRMGQPKMLLPWGDSTVLGQVVKTFAEAGLRQIIVVTGAQREPVSALVSQLATQYPVRSIHNPNYESGEMLSSMQCGLTNLGPEIDAALIGLGDQPQLTAVSVRGILAMHATSGGPIIVPSFQRRRGHPWLVERQLWAEICAMRTPGTARDFLNHHAECIRYFEADSPSVNQDLDTPEEYARLVGAGPHQAKS